MVRGAAIGGAAFGIWAYAISLDSQGRVVRKRWRFFWLAAATLGLVLAGGWIVTEQLGHRYDQELAADVQASAAQVQDHLVMEMEATSDAARMVARLLSRFDIAPALARGGSPRLDEIVDAVAGVDEEHVAYVLDASGTTVAASNRGRPDGFLGKSYAHRPYFRDAIAGAPGRFIGIGITSGKPGFYASEPIRDGSGRVVGVAVVKHVLTADSFGPLGTGISFLVGSDGNVLLAATDAWKGRPGVVARPGGGARRHPAPGAAPRRALHRHGLVPRRRRTPRRACASRFRRSTGRSSRSSRNRSGPTTGCSASSSRCCSAW